MLYFVQNTLLKKKGSLSISASPVCQEDTGLGETFSGFCVTSTMALDVISKGLGHKHSVTFGVINGVTSAIQRTKVTLTVTLNGTGRDTHTNGDTHIECP